MSASGFPWINIPMVADTGEQQAFVQRREELAVLYRGLVEAGNSVRAGRLGIHRKFVVHGFLGVGKSALVLEALRRIRELPQGGPAGADDLPVPEDPERWLILRVSGKHVFGLDGMLDSLRREVIEEGDATESAEPTPGPRLGLYASVHQQVEQAAPGVLQLTPLHHLLRSRESRLYEQVRADLRDLAQAIERAASALPEPPPSSASTGATGESALQSERRQRDEAHLLVEALNRFFRTAAAAGLPTLLFLDDFDELAVPAAASPPARARMLQAVLSDFSQLAPTCLILTLRSEYMNEALLRQYRRIYLAPLSRADARTMLGIWAQAQRPALDGETTQRLQELGDRFLKEFEEDELVVVPFRFLQLVAWLANNLLIYGLQDADEEKMLWRYFSSKYPLHVVRALRRVMTLMPIEHVTSCANTSPLSHEPYAELAAYERLTLERAGLLRPAVASDPTDPRIVLDPLCAYLRTAAVRGGSKR